ncbi:hypothetical protein GQX73_g3860 [Xylaria multiplex]|uniref:Zn(2)-C6 fungal-type domain-containing protein n=1 Tax=Xylaria multiplex TaxID=323545 RepID=A0A7C8ITC6_9PEZI|nr:hypothetical protein GQX73_g3860 [Xylaria multiplex]
MTDKAGEPSRGASRLVGGIGHGGSLVSPSEAEKRANVSAVSASTSAHFISSPAVIPTVAANNNTPTSTTAATTTTPKLRSCVVCRSRKVRCDKQSPCSNCRRAGIPCVIPSTDRPPRWARRLERFAHNAAAGERTAAAVDPPTAQVMERLRNLESLVKDLSGQLEQAHAIYNPSTGNSPASSTNDRDGEHQTATPFTTSSGLHSQFGRLVLNDAGRSRYVSSGFWSRVNDELDEIKMEAQHLAEVDPDSTENEDRQGSSPASYELERTPSERHAFLFRHNLNSPGPDPRGLHPLPSQVPFLLDIFSENINAAVQIVHMPTINKMARHSRGSGSTPMTPSNEALMFAIYYAAITSMEDDDVMNNFGSAKAELSLKYRLGFEHAAARADFFNTPDIVLVQAFAIFLLLVRLNDSPRFVWMMTGLVIRMAQSLGLQRDGSHFKHLAPYEVDTRRRVWYALCSLDVRASEDQGTDFTIQQGSFDTKLPLNINDDDIDVDTTETPIEREGITDRTVSIVTMEISNISRRMITPGVGLEEQNRLISTIYATLEDRYLKFSTEVGNIVHWVLAVTTRLVCAKLTLFTHLPVLFSSPGENLSDEIRNKLLIAAIEVAEFNHALNSEKASRQWRWIYQTYTHWHAIVYILIDICRRPWSSLVERAWIALHSPWLIPAKSKLDRGLQTWVPLRKLMFKARQHRDAELERLRGDESAARQLEIDDRNLPVPSTVGSVSASTAADISRGKWRRLVGISEISQDNTFTETRTLPSFELTNSAQDFLGSPGVGLNNAVTADAAPQPIYSSMTPFPMHASGPPATSDAMAVDHLLSNGPQYNVFSETPLDWSDGHPENNGLLGWFWADSDPNMDIFADVGIDSMDFNADLDGAMDWHSWVESAKGMEMDAHTNASRPNR